MRKSAIPLESECFWTSLRILIKEEGQVKNVTAQLENGYRKLRSITLECCEAIGHYCGPPTEQTPQFLISNF